MGITSLLFGENINKTDELFISQRAPIRSVPLLMQKDFFPKVTGNHVYLEVGSGQPIIFSHGLFGGIFNISKVATELSKKYRFIMPYLPMYDMALKDCTVLKLGDYLESFINDMQLENAVIIGSSMGGGAALHYASKPLNKVKGLVLCGSSGLSNIPLSKGYFKRRNFDFVKESTQDIFFNRSIPPDEMVQDVFDAIQNYEVVLRSIRFTKNATNQRMNNIIPNVKTPCLLVWGRQDPITAVEVVQQFLELLPDAQLHIVKECGHVPTQEKPDEFLNYFFRFLEKINFG